MSELNFDNALENLSEVLPPDKLRELQDRAVGGVLDVRSLSKELSPAVMALIALGVGAAQDRKLDQVPDSYRGRIRQLGEYIETHAPALLQNSDFAAIAEGVLEDIGQYNLEERSTPPFEDISAVRCIPMFLGLGKQLVPVIRLDVIGREARRLISQPLRPSDMAFLSSALLDGIADALDLMHAVNQKGLLQDGELGALRQRADEIAKSLEAFRSKLAPADADGVKNKVATVSK